MNNKIKYKCHKKERYLYKMYNIENKNNTGKKDNIRQLYKSYPNVKHVYINIDIIIKRKYFGKKYMIQNLVTFLIEK